MPHLLPLSEFRSLIFSHLYLGDELTETCIALRHLTMGKGQQMDCIPGYFLLGHSLLIINRLTHLWKEVDENINKVIINHFTTMTAINNLPDLSSSQRKTISAGMRWQLPWFIYNLLHMLHICSSEAKFPFIYKYFNPQYFRTTLSEKFH